MNGRPDLKLAVTRGTTPDTYTFKAVVSDLRSGSVLATPVMSAHAGAAARAEVGGDHSSRTRFAGRPNSGISA